MEKLGATQKKLIEVSIPLEAINAAAVQEKAPRPGHPSTLHLWWARRPLAACRAVLFTQVVDDPSSWPNRFPTEEAQDAERRRLHDLVKRLVPWEASNNEGILNEARWEIARSVAWGLGEEPPPKKDEKAVLDYLQTKGPPVYDPFCGGGSIPLEAQRLGLRAYGSDLNPVAVLISKALVEIPPHFAGQPPINPMARAELKHGGRWNGKGAQGLADDVRYYGQWIRDKAEKRIGHLYPKPKLPDGSKATVIAWIWARTVRSPDPAAKGAMVPLVSSFMLSTREGKKAWIEPVTDPDASNGYRFEVRMGSLSKRAEDEVKKGTKASRGASFTCLLTGAPIDPAYVRAEAQAGRMKAVPLAVVVEGARGRVFLPIDAAQEKAALNVRAEDSPDEVLHKNSRYMTPTVFGLERVGDLFLDRQIVALNTLIAELASARKQISDDLKAVGRDDPERYVEALVTYLALCISRQVNRCSTLCFWDAGGLKVQQVFARQALSMTWDFVEANPFSSSSGNFVGQVEYLARVVEKNGTGGFADIRHAAAQKAPVPDGAIISTDPPYYDNVPYADISDFFYVWLRRALRAEYPDLFARILTPKDEELVAFPERHGGQDEADSFFISAMGKVFTELNIKSNPHYPTVIYYAFRQAEADADLISSPGWATFLQSVVNSGLAIDGTWPIRTELVGNLKKKKNALASSIVLVCRKLDHAASTVTRSEFIRALKRELPQAIDDIRKAGVGPVDMQQSVIGPGMGIFTRYTKVLEDDDSSMNVKTALTLINRVWEEIENELDANFDAETQVALAWFSTYGFDAKPSGELITLANAKNIPLPVLFASKVFQDHHGKAGLTPREALAIAGYLHDLGRGETAWQDRLRTVWGCLQHIIRVLKAEDGGAEAAGRLIAQVGPKAAAARLLAERLYQIAAQKGWQQEALVYNELAQEWPTLEEFAQNIMIPDRIVESAQARLL